MNSLLRLQYHTSILLLVFFCSPLVAAEPYRMSYLEFPPYWYGTEIEGSNGLHYDLVETIFKNAKLDVTFVSTPWARILSNVETGNSPFVNWAVAPNNDELVWLPIPPTNIHLMIVSKSKPETWPQSPEDFKGKRIASVRGWRLINLEPIRTDQDVVFMKSNSLENALRLLQVGRVDFVLAYKEPFSGLNEKVQKALFTHPVDSITAYALAIPKSHPEGELLYKKVKASFDDLVERKVIDKNVFTELDYLTNK